MGGQGGAGGKSQEQTDANAEAKKLASIVNSTDGSKQALQTMLSDYQNYQKTNGTASATTYWNDLTQQLNDSSSPLLPDLSLIAMKPLLANNAALMKSLDISDNPGSNTNIDGHVATKDVTAWLQKAHQAQANGDTNGIYTNANIAYVTALQNNTLGIGVNQNGQIAFDSSGAPVFDKSGAPVLQNDDTTSSWHGWDGFSIRSLAVQGGFNATNSYSDTVINYDNAMNTLGFPVSNTDCTPPGTTSCIPPETTSCPPKDAFSSLPQAQQTAINNQVTKDFVALSTAQPGDGYIRITERLLGVTSETPEVNTLYRQIEKADNHARLYRATDSNPASQALTPELLSQLNDPALTAQMTADRNRLVSENFGASS